MTELSLNIPTVKDIFDEFRKMYPGTKRGLDVEFSNFVKKYPKNYFNLVNQLMPNLLRQINEKKEQAKNNTFVANWKNLQTYINQQAWTEEFTVQYNNDLYANRKVSTGQQSASDKRAGIDRMEELARAILQNTANS
jgi:hypothetical protein